MEELKCPNCGAPINRATMRCDYCGAVFKSDQNFIIRQIENPKIIPLKTAMKVDNEFIRIGNGYEKYLMDEMAYSLGKQIVKYMEVVTQDDPALDRTIVYGRVRVVPPNENIW